MAEQTPQDDDFESLLEEAIEDEDDPVEDPAENWIKRQIAGQGWTRGTSVW